MSDTIYVVKIPNSVEHVKWFFDTREAAQAYITEERDAYLERQLKRITGKYEELVERTAENNIAAQALIDAGVENPLIALQTAPSRDNYIIPRLRREEEFFSTQTRITEVHRYVK